ncbi:MAG: Uma2 family endonuclease [Anaerolineae bacterium]|nr:Uma2 family endonuclease [Anaerolineae bacterium]
MVTATQLQQQTIPSPPVRMTWDEFVAWLDEDIWAEWVDGEVIVHSPASTEHQRTSKFIEWMIGAYFSERPIGELFTPPYLMRLSSRPSGREPDLLVVLNEHADRLTENYLDGPADLVIEIASPATQDIDRGEKFSEYEAAGIPEYWLIDPMRKTAILYRRDADGYYQQVMPDAEGRLHSAVLPGLELEPAWLWQEGKPNYAQVLDLVREMLT